VEGIFVTDDLLVHATAGIMDSLRITDDRFRMAD
jgi:hypothetical protein